MSDAPKSRCTFFKFAYLQLISDVLDFGNVWTCANRVGKINGNVLDGMV